MNAPVDDRDALARRCAEALQAADLASRRLGMAVLSVAAGRATLAMTVTEEMTNGHGNCHGGFIFSLADSAFGYACNSHDQRCVSQHCTVTYIAPAKKGMRLVAEAIERHRAGRSGITDVTVRDETGAVIAEFRGHSRTVPGTVLRG